MMLFHIIFYFVFGFSWQSFRTWSLLTRWPLKTSMQLSQRPSWTRPNIHTGHTSPLLICNGINEEWLYNKDYVFQLKQLNDAILLKNNMHINRLLSFIPMLQSCKRKQFPVEGTVFKSFTLTVDLNCVCISNIAMTASGLYATRLENLHLELVETVQK